MKRVLVGLSALVGVVVLGCIAIAQSQRGDDPSPRTTGGSTSMRVEVVPGDSSPSPAPDPLFSKNPFVGRSAAERSSTASEVSISDPTGETRHRLDESAEGNSALAPSQPGEPRRIVGGPGRSFMPASAITPLKNTVSASDSDANAYAPGSIGSEPTRTEPARDATSVVLAAAPGDEPGRYGEQRIGDGDANAGYVQAADEPFQGGAAYIGQSPTGPIDPEPRPFPVAEPLTTDAPANASRDSLPPEASTPFGASGYRAQAMPATSGSRRFSGPNGSVGTGRPGESTLEGSQTPSLTIEKSAPAEMQVGKPAVVEILVRNSGTAAARQVEVHDELPVGAELLSTTPQATSTPEGRLVWKVGTLKPGDEAALLMEIKPLFEGEIGSVATVQFAAEASVRSLVTKPELAIEVLAPSQVMVGDDIVFDIRVTNTGSGVATAVVLAEAVPVQFQHPAGAELERDLGEIHPKESLELQLTMTAVKAGRIVNTMTAIGDGRLSAEAHTPIEVVAPELTVALDGPKRRYLDREAHYTVEVANPGTASAGEVQLLTYLPQGMEFVNANNAGRYDSQMHAVHWLLEELPAQAMGAVEMTLMPVDPGELTLRVEGRADRGLAAETSQAVLVEGVAAILFQVQDLEDPIEVGADTVYEIRVINQGSAAATNIQVMAQLPAQMRAIEADGPVRQEVAGAQVVFDPLVQLAPGAETKYRIRARGLQPGDMRMRVQVLTDDIRTPVTKEESTRVFGDE